MKNGMQTERKIGNKHSYQTKGQRFKIGGTGDKMDWEYGGRVEQIMPELL